MRKFFLIISLVFVGVMSLLGNGNRIDSLKQNLDGTFKLRSRLPILIQLGEYYSDSARYRDLAASYLEEALSILQKHPNDSLKVSVLNYYGLSEYIASNYESSATRFFDAIALAEKLNDQHQLCKLFNNLGMVFDEIEDYDQAINYYRKSYEIDSIFGNEKGVGMSYLNMGISFQNKMKLDTAYSLNLKALEIARKYNDSISLVNVTNNLGTLEYDRKNYQKSLDYYDQALSLYQMNNDLEGVAVVYGNIGLTYLDIKQFSKALSYLKQALSLAKKLKMADYVGDVYSNLSEYYEAVGDFRHAFTYNKLYHQINDSLLGQAKNQNIRKLEAKYRLDKKQNEIVNLQQLNLDQQEMIRMSKVTQFYLYVIIFLVVVILIAGYLIFRKEKQLTKELHEKTLELKKLNSDKDKFFSIIAHDLKNPFNALISYTSLLKSDIDRFSKKELTQILTDLNTSTERGFNLLENLLFWTRSQTNRIKVFKTDFNLYTLVEDIKDLAQSNLDGKSQTLEIKLDEKIQVHADKEMTATVIRNLVFNSIKFSNSNTEIRIEAERINRQVQVSVIDQGVGIDPIDHVKIFDYQNNSSSAGTNGEMGSGLGLAICREFVEKNGGLIWVESEKGEGATFRFTLPLTTNDSSK